MYNTTVHINMLIEVCEANVFHHQIIIANRIHYLLDLHAGGDTQCGKLFIQAMLIV